jgi:Flp pilus assembly protein TadG
VLNGADSIGTSSAGTGRDEGSVLMLMPAAVLIVLVLGSIAFDFSLVYLRQRQALSAAAGAANDAATAAVDADELRSTGQFVLLADRAREVANASLAASDVADEIIAVDVRPDGDAVTVTVTIRAEYVFAKAFPFAPDGQEIEVQATAVADPG